MILSIDTGSYDKVIITVRQSGQVIAQKEFSAPQKQAEKLLPALDKLLRSKKIKLKDISKIMVANEGGSFTSLRIGIVTANALAYALNIPVSAIKEVGDSDKKFAGHNVVEPIYNNEPIIGKVKK